jgi:hypothetical protein
VVFAPKGWKGAVSPYYGKNNWWSEITRKTINGNVEKTAVALCNVYGNK